nr:hypothetical protein [Tanacetum cinerariifolium]
MGRSFTLGSTEEADNVKILQSCNGLLLCGDGFGSRELTFYEMMIGVLCGWLGTVFIQMNLVLPFLKLSGKIIQYNLLSKTLHEIYDCESNQVDENHDDNDDDDDADDDYDDDDDDELL